MIPTNCNIFQNFIYMSFSKLDEIGKLTFLTSQKDSSRLTQFWKSYLVYIRRFVVLRLSRPTPCIAN